jgi:hypothetical protein
VNCATGASSFCWRDRDTRAVEELLENEPGANRKHPRPTPTRTRTPIDPMHAVIIVCRWPVGLAACFAYAVFHFVLRFPLATAVLPFAFVCFAVTGSKRDIERSWIRTWPDLGFRKALHDIWDWVYDPNSRLGL